MLQHQVRVLVEGRSSRPHTGRITGLWHGREGIAMAVAFPAGDGPALPLGRAAQFGFEGGPFETAVDAAGLITSRSEGDEADAYHARFGDAAYPVLGVLFEKRLSPRVPPDEAAAPAVALRSLEGAARPVAAGLVDLSAGGVRVRLPLTVEQQLAACSRVRVGLSFPGEDAPLVFDGDVSNRSLMGDEVIYGIGFEAPRAEDPRLERLRRYVEQRLAALSAQGRVPSSFDDEWELPR